jgi:hypothetical protein
MKQANLITQSRVQELLEYREGQLYWRKDHGIKARKGQLAGKVDSANRRRICIDYKSFGANRLVWIYFNGEAKGQIDHINGDVTDDRIENLRDVSQSQNMQNLRQATKRNKSGLLGVSLHKQTGKYRARISINGKSIVVKYCDTPEEAHMVYLQAKRQFHSTCTI